MHFTGRTWRPPYEAASFIIQATSGCTYGRCRFCALYQGERFRMSPLTEWEEDLKELSQRQPTARRIFWTGANPFAMSYERLRERALMVHEYLKECQTMAMFASVRDIMDKRVWQLRRLRALGINGLSIGAESGDDATLRLANKGYTAKDIIDQCRKLDEAGIEYYLVYMTGLAGAGNGGRNAIRSADTFSKVNPRFISVDSLTLFEGTALHNLAARGEFAPATERERLEELQTFIRRLKQRTHLFADSVSNYYPTSAYLPKEKERILGELQHVLDTTSEEEMARYRGSLTSL